MRCLSPVSSPHSSITWFQAAATARNSFKRLPSNAEWQAAALGTPDAGANPGAQDCNTYSTGPDLTGARTNCVSDAGAFDMVGNVSELVGEWVPLSTHPCGTWGNFSDDIQCLVGADTTLAGPARPSAGATSTTARVPGSLRCSGTPGHSIGSPASAFAPPANQGLAVPARFLVRRRTGRGRDGAPRRRPPAHAL
jgi:sulfatase-modifying factor enzyme 1